MSSGYCSQDEESDDSAFFTAKSSFFRQPQGQKEAKAADRPHTGFIDVHLRLRRPISEVKEGGTPAGNAEHDGPESRADSDRPGGQVKRVHVSSSTTVREVIQALLGKFSAQNDPCKFTLYRQTHRDGQEVLQKLTQSEHPLRLQQEAEPDGDPKALTFVLRENDKADVEWNAFSVPELHNFLAILEKEEELRVGQVERRYKQYREKLLKVLQEAEGKPG
ncbi:hypothetical protein AGOR_G00133450 [Albula goreensis]|uniref:Ras association domain-containing protein 5 n=1 Tax=Albula goreensis TaxID=1534307 RepID=A0A8T3D838_9TELE|nr:hypothetical protein AGOR_G00133450 [Albula goreensis]